MKSASEPQRRTTSTKDSEHGLIWLIVNERAGRGRGALAGNAARDALVAKGARVETRATRGAGDALVLAREARDAGAKIVAAVGGDGTLHEVLNGLAGDIVASGQAPDPSRLPALGAIPVGSGNDYVKMLGVSRTDPRLAAESLLAGTAKPVDVGLLEGAGPRTGDAAPELFLNNLGLAFAGDANARIEQTRGLPGGLAYFLGAAMSFFTYEFALTEVEIDGKLVQKGRPVIVHINLGKYCGGGVIFTPEAELDDGFFDVLILGEVTRLHCIWIWNAITSGKGRSLSDVSILRAREVKVRGPADRLLHADGEVRRFVGDEVRARVIPRAINVIHAAPPAGQGT